MNKILFSFWLHNYLNKKNYVEFSKILLDIKNNHSRLEFDISNGISLIRDSYDVDIIDDGIFICYYWNSESHMFRCTA